MKVTETITRDCCDQRKDLKPVEGAKRCSSHSQLMFCVYCGARWECHHFMDPAGGTDWEYKKCQ